MPGNDNRSKTWGILKRTALILLAAWLGIVILAALFYPFLLYQPERKKLDLLPDQFGMEYEALWLTAADGVRLNAWRVPAANDNAAKRRALLVFHGNAGNMSLAMPRFQMYRQMGVDVYMIDYHGFGQSDGEPSEANLYLAAETIWRHLVEERNIEPGDIVIMGYSLGGAVAAWLAEQRPAAAGLILESTFTRLSDVAENLFPWLPCRLILGSQFDSMGRLANIAMPLLVIHGKRDELVPFASGQKLFEAYKNGPKTFVTIADDHNIGFLLSEKEYTKEIKTFLDSLP